MRIIDTSSCPPEMHLTEYNESIRSIRRRNSVILFLLKIEKGLKRIVNCIK